MSIKGDEVLLFRRFICLQSDMSALYQLRTSGAGMLKDEISSLTKYANRVYRFGVACENWAREAKTF